MGAYEERLAILEANQKTLFKRLDKQDKMLEAIHETNKSLAIQGEAIERMAADLGHLSERVVDLEERPAKRWEMLVGCVLTGVTGLIFGYLASLL